MHGDHIVPFGLRHVEDHTVSEDAGRGYHDVEAPELVESLLNDVRSACCSRDRVVGSDGAAA